MSYFRTLSATLVSAAASFSLVTASCGTNAVGIDDCREIELARCDAGAYCPVSGGGLLVPDVAACRRYYRDHCLHGFATKPPAGASVAACVRVIKAAGVCAQEDPESELSCTETESASRQGLRTACDLILRPELATECAFLLETPDDDPDDGSGGSAGQSGSEATAGQATGGADTQAQ